MAKTKVEIEYPSRPVKNALPAGLKTVVACLPFFVFVCGVGARQDEQMSGKKDSILQSLVTTVTTASTICVPLQARSGGDNRLPSSTEALLHPESGRRRRRRARHGNAGGRVDDGDGVAVASGSRLVQLQGRLLTLVARGKESWRG